MIQKIKSSFSGNTLQAKISKGIAWSFLGTVISKGMLLLSFILIARILTVEEYGQVSILRNFIVTFSMFSVASFGITATKYITTYKDEDIEKTSKILTLTRLFVLISSLVISIGILIFSEYIAINFLHDISLIPEVQISAITIFFTALNGYQNGALAGFENFKGISIVNTVNGLLTLPTVFFGAYYWGVHGVVTGLAIIAFMTWTSSFFYLHKSTNKYGIHTVLKDLKSEFIILYEFSLPSFLSGMIVAPVTLTVNSLLTSQSDGYFQLGIFTAALNFSLIALTLTQIIGQVLFPYAMKHFDSGNRKFEFVNILLPWFISIFINLPILIFPEITAYIYGDRYHIEEYYLSVVIITLYSIIMAYKQGIARNFAAANLMWWSMFGNGLWGFIALFSALFLVSYGSVGIAIAFLIAHVLSNVALIPLYINKKLISKELIFSKESLILWMIIIGASPTYFLTLNLFIKTGLLILLYFIIVLIVQIAWKKNSGEINEV